MSIDAADPSPVFEDLTINEIESCVELVVEVVLGKEDAIQETSEHDHSTHKPANSIHLFSMNDSTILIENAFQVLPVKTQNPYAANFKSYEHQIVSPPPKG